MKEDFKSLTEVLNYNKEVLVIDLLQHALMLEKDTYHKALVEPQAGIYLPGSIEPFILENGTYYFRSGYPNPANKITDIRKIFSEPYEDVLDFQGNLILSAKNIVTKRKYYTFEPTIPTVAIKMGIAVVQRYLNTLCHHYRHGYNSYHMEKLVKEEHYELIEKDEYLHAYEKLLDEVAAFVGDDHWNIYFYKLKGTSMIITKGCDWRIFKYYEAIFNVNDPNE